jgi:cytochrome c553
MQKVGSISPNLRDLSTYGGVVFLNRYFLIGLAGVVWAPGLLCAGETAAESAQVIFQNLCASCHGAKGEGKVELKAPSIASLPAWYVQRQLESFQKDRRGAHPQDTEGQMMGAMAKVLSAAQTTAIAKVVEKLPRVTPEQTIKVDVERGRELYEERCMECHRYNGEGELVFGAAPLVGLQDWYLAAQLRKFKTGVRGAAKDDESGQKMVKVTANFVEDEDMVRSLAAWLIQLQGPKKPSIWEQSEIKFGKD